MKSQDAILERPSENIASFNSIIHGGYRLHILFCALVSGALLLTKKKSIKDSIPMGPFILAGFYTVVILGVG